MTITQADFGADKNEQFNRVIEFENECTPAEFISISNSKVPEIFAARISDTAKTILLLNKTPRSFIRQEICEDAVLYTARNGRSKSLVIGFCGRAHRLMLPLPIFLQIFPEADFDLLLLRDRSQRLFLGGINGLGVGFAETISTLSRLVKEMGYEDTRCYGTSAGGAPALYAALGLGSSVGLSISGKHPKVLQGNMQFPAGFDGTEFDILNSPPMMNMYHPDLTAVFGSDCPRDEMGADVIAQHIPSVSKIVLEDCASHNINAWLLKRGTLRQFHETFLFKKVER